ncbi:hypothetical protein EMPG_14826 [Blastomyces silverae]|uniref:Uncharacterized protein n=1 Tax=Blastomyces silverae TaxID=2060906 RepID=A0A0H1BKP9_9EURO|nr:hypothetical protein EMPG_14826 [Blastomyces silverae]
MIKLSSRGTGLPSARWLNVVLFLRMWIEPRHRNSGWRQRTQQSLSGRISLILHLGNSGASTATVRGGIPPASLTIIHISPLDLLISTKRRSMIAICNLQNSYNNT